MGVDFICGLRFNKGKTLRKDITTVSFAKWYRRGMTNDRVAAKVFEGENSYADGHPPGLQFKVTITLNMGKIFKIFREPPLFITQFIQLKILIIKC